MGRIFVVLAAGIFIMAAALVSGLALFADPAPDHPYYAAPGFRIIAHRGGLGLGPENTIEVFKRSLAAGADVLEMDLRTTRDGQLVLLHDATVDRTTNGTGFVHDMTLSEVQKLDAGFRWEANGKFPFRNKGIVIPTLDQVLKTFADTPLVIEIKENRPGICGDVCRLIKENRKTDSVLIASMHSPVLKRFRTECPQVATSAGPRSVLIFHMLNKIGLTSIFMPGMAVAFQVPLEFRGQPVATPEFVSAAHRRNLKVEV